MAEIIQEQPEDATYEEIMRGLAYLPYRKGYFQRRDGSADSNMAEIIKTSVDVWHEMKESLSL